MPTSPPLINYGDERDRHRLKNMFDWCRDLSAVTAKKTTNANENFAPTGLALAA